MFSDGTVTSSLEARHRCIRIVHTRYCKVGRNARLRCHHVTLNTLLSIHDLKENSLLPGQLPLELLYCSAATNCQTRANTWKRQITFQSYLSSMSVRVCPAEKVSGIALFFPKDDPPSRQLSASVMCLRVMVIWEQSFRVGLRGNEVCGRRRVSYWLLQARRSPCLYMRIPGAGELIKTLIYWNWSQLWNWNCGTIYYINLAVVKKKKKKSKFWQPTSETMVMYSKYYEQYVVFLLIIHNNNNKK